MAYGKLTAECGIYDELAEEQPYIAPPRGMYQRWGKDGGDVPIGQWGGKKSVPLSSWRPTLRQRDVLSCPVQELFFGGSRGPGKTDLLIADFDQMEQAYGAAANGILFRRTQPEFAEVLRKCHVMLNGRAQWSEKDGMWRYPSGAILRLAYLDAFRHVGRYQGHEFTWIGFDEVTEYADPAPYLYMFSCLRNTKGVPGLIRSTGNPGRPGHLWIEQRFVAGRDPREPFQDPETKILRVFMDAQLEDNPYLWQKDPDYENRLRGMSIDEATYQAQRYGRWDVHVGQALHEWNPSMHLMEPIRLDPRWPRWASLDWGTRRPYALLYFTRTPDGHVYQFRERYGIKLGKYGEPVPNHGTGENGYEVASDEWNNFACDNNVTDIVCDDSIVQDHGVGDTVINQFKRVGWNVSLASGPVKDRKKGKAAVHNWLGKIMRDGYPMFRIFDTCEHTIRTLPTLVYNSRTGDEEEIDKEGEDHIFDSIRYSAMSRFADESSITVLRDQYGYDGYNVDEQRMKDFDVNDKNLIWRDGLPGFGNSSSSQARPLSRDEQKMRDFDVNDPRHIWGNDFFDNP